MPEPEKQFTEVAIDVPIRKTFTYSVPEPLRGEIEAGKRVLVPFGKREVEGYCVGFVPEPEFDRVRAVLKVLDDEVMLDEKMLSFTKWIADYYRCSWGEVLAAALPIGVREDSGVRMKRLIRPAVPPSRLAEEISKLRKRSPAQADVLEAVAGSDRPMTPAEAAKAAGRSVAVVNALAEKGLVNFTEEKAALDPLVDMPVEKTEPLKLNSEQRMALNRIREKVDDDSFGVFLLYGVNGSGKTEVYMQAIAHAVSRGKQAIMLVPEISLTPQTIRRFRGRFDRVAVMHSRMSPGELNQQWQSIRRGEKDVILGVRSAIFAPVPSLGLIVVDEEHENTFKQESAPRYHVRDMAVLLGQRTGCAVVLGSATPSLESFYNASIGKYEMLRLRKRIGNRPMPVVNVVDMQQEHRAVKKFTHISRRMIELLRETLRRGEKAVIFLNRRGFATSVRCRLCGFVMNCERCGIPMTYYKSRNIGLCNQCGLKKPVPRNCPECGDVKYLLLGAGTERVEEYITALVPEAKIARMDSDSTRTRGSHRLLLDSFNLGSANVLLGTQMIAKGLDYPEVTFVGVVNADVALHLQDFRASEKTFQLLSQVAGRAGRGDKPGIVVIQTSKPEHYCIRFAARHDYDGFAAEELKHRRMLRYPPYSRLARIILRGKSSQALAKKGKAIVKALLESRLLRRENILGPAEAPIERVKARLRWHLLLKARDWTTLHAALNAAETELASSGGVNVTVDVDPMTML